MNLHLTSRRLVAGRFRLLAVVALCLLTLPCASAYAQHPGGGGPGGGGPGGPGRPMGSSPMGMSGPRSDMRGNAGEISSDRMNRSGQPRMGLQLGLGGRWWDDHHTAHKLNISSDQQRRMDSIFETSQPTLTALYSNYQHEEISLASLSPSDLKDENKVFAAIDRVSHARSDLEKEYAHVFLQVRQQLDPQQLESLDRQIANAH